GGLITAPPGSLRVLRLTLIAIALASAMGAWSCDRGDAASARRPRDATDAIRQVRPGQTTPGDHEARVRVGDQAAADGPVGVPVGRRLVGIPVRDDATTHRAS